jgi:hypothetical protein
LIEVTIVCYSLLKRKKTYIQLQREAIKDWKNISISFLSVSLSLRSGKTSSELELAVLLNYGKWVNSPTDKGARLHSIASLHELHEFSRKQRIQLFISFNLNTVRLI